MSNKRLWQLNVSATFHYQNSSKKNFNKTFCGHLIAIYSGLLFQKLFEPVKDLYETPAAYFEFPEGEQAAYMYTADE
jgi:hypothetical protein